ncbi:TraB/GumN family protein [Altererythrobacter lutimaris]|uniref:TraB/GumN family protein n=1 Tax=Altererythrobacter lutimaris TaxID=2743979 RepID=A0A850HB56_9SPHN|nr:TraB/GumN family protein [Altererythrobacter lutimaris]NVE93758.1 TraB/GumN family protein [Altererythrobacter lutimaris]
MKNTFRTLTGTLALSVAFLSTPASADDHAAATTAPAVAEAPAGPALWSVADEDTTIYLFGTVHALPKDVEWLDEDISSALAASDTLVTEVDMEAMAGPKMVELVQTTAVLPAGTTLRSLMSEDQVKIYEAAMQKIQVPPAAFDQFEPWYAGMMMSLVPLMQQGYSPDAGVEAVLIKQAGEIDKDALETVEFQLGVFDGLPQDAQVKFLIEASESVDEIKPMLDAMVAEWLEGDAEGLADIMNESLDDEALAEALLYYRNRNWADWIETRMDAPGTVFMAVGAGHLAGEKSVQDYLEQRGMTVTRVQ